jgi:hypothetical protein
MASTVALLAAACSSAQTCQDLLDAYETEAPVAAVCDPTAANPCSVQLPLIVALQLPDGGLMPQALAECEAGFSPAHSAQLEQILASYQALNCRFEPVPGCPSAPTQCFQGAMGASCTP